MRKLILALAASLIAAPAIASDTTDIASTIKAYNDDFGKGDLKAFEAFCSAQIVIVDDFAPHVWQGASACGDWASALAASDKKDGISGEKVTLDKPWHVTATDDRGYAVFPTHYSYTKNGKPVTELGVWTFALQKLSGAWRITGWAWAQH